MAGTLFGIGLSQPHDLDGKPLINARLYIYTAGGLTPVNAYRDFALTNPHTYPIPTDAFGRLPQFWVADGSYRARLVDVNGVVQFDELSITAIGASTGEGGGGSVDSNALIQTGDEFFRKVGGTRSGWVRQNGRTIGSATSGASERANSDCETLFLYLWNGFTNTQCPVSGGRGASAAADWAANKTITLPDMRGRGPVGQDAMGNSRANVLADTSVSGGDTGDTAAAIGGAYQKTIAKANLPSYTLTGGSGTTLNLFQSATSAQSGGGVSAINAAAGDTPFPITGITIPSGGSGTALDVMNPFALGTWYIKL